MCTQPYRDIFTAAKREHTSVFWPAFVFLHTGACTLFSGLLNLEPCCCHISVLACLSQKQSCRPDLCWAAGAVEVTQRFFEKTENKNFPLGAGKLHRRAHKALKLLVSGVSFTRSTAQGAWPWFLLAYGKEARLCAGGSLGSLPVLTAIGQSQDSRPASSFNQPSLSLRQLESPILKGRNSAEWITQFKDPRMDQMQLTDPTWWELWDRDCSITYN